MNNSELTIRVIRFLTDIWTLQVGFDETYLYDNGGSFMSREKWEKTKTEVDQFYLKYSDEEIEEMNREQLRLRSQKREELPEQPPKPKKGHVYLLHGEGTQWYKIGVSTNLQRRIKEIATKSPFKVVLVATFPADDIIAEEARWHAEFSDKRVEGEWFELSENDVERFMAER